MPYYRFLISSQHTYAKEVIISTVELYNTLCKYQIFLFIYNNHLLKISISFLNYFLEIYIAKININNNPEHIFIRNCSTYLFTL